MAARSTKIAWDHRPFCNQIRNELLSRLDKVGQYLQKDIKRRLQRPVVKIKVRKRGGGTRTIVLPLSRSRPGQYPKKVTGRLIRSIRYKVYRRGEFVRVYTTSRYGAIHNSGVRPFLASTYNKRRRKINRMLLRKIRTR